MIIPTEDDSEIEKNIRYKRLKFEVRIPQITLEQLVMKSFLLIETRSKSIKAVGGQKDKNTSKAWYEFDTALADKFYGTEDHDISKNELQELMEYAEYAENFITRLNSNSEGVRNNNK